ALAAPADPKHAHVAFETEAGARITFFDPRRFGYMDLIATDRLDEHPRFLGMGPEPLEGDFDGAWLKRAFAGRRQNPKTLLLDQRIVAGLGNIYVCEALYRARISPLKLAYTVPGARAARLVPAIKATLTEAIAAGGSSLRDYVQPDGELGYFQHAWKVYGREGERCVSCPGESC